MQLYRAFQQKTSTAKTEKLNHQWIRKGGDNSTYLLSFKREIIPAASAGEGWPCDEDKDSVRSTLWCAPLEEPPGVEGREEPITDGGYQDWVGISWLFAEDGLSWFPLYISITSEKMKPKEKAQSNILE